jgi:dihydroxyacid dehydratase/phosphogluconate dehydratase
MDKAFFGSFCSQKKAFLQVDSPLSPPPTCPTSDPVEIMANHVDDMSGRWFDNPGNPAMTAPCVERYLNFGLTAEELQGGKPIIGIPQTGSLFDNAVMKMSVIDQEFRTRYLSHPDRPNVFEGPETAIGGGLALLKTDDRIRIDLNTLTVDVLLPEGELAARRAAWVPPVLENKTPWEQI